MIIINFHLKDERKEKVTKISLKFILIIQKDLSAATTEHHPEREWLKEHECVSRHLIHVFSSVLYCTCSVTILFIFTDCKVNFYFIFCTLFDAYIICTVLCYSEMVGTFHVLNFLNSFPLKRTDT